MKSHLSYKMYPRRVTQLAAGVLGLALAVSAQIQVSVSPPSLPWTSNTWVNVVVSNVTVGAEVDLRLYVDVDGDGALSGVDQLVASFRVQDGVTNSLGSSLIVDDMDHATNGIIASRIAYFHQEGMESPIHIVGNYLWAASPVVGDTATARFAVTQPTSTVWVTGSVIDYVTSNAIPGAIVELATAVDVGNLASWTDTNGEFMIYVPTGLSTADVDGVTAGGVGYITSDDPVTGGSIAEYSFSADLNDGNNPLSTTLRLVPVFSNQVFSVSGYLYDDKTNALPGVTMWAYWDTDPQSMAITDTNGAYCLAVPAGITGNVIVFPDPNSLMYIGAFATRRSLLVTNAVAGVDLYCPSVTLLGRGSVLAADDLSPVAGVPVYYNIDSDNTDLGATLRGEGISLPDGTFQVGLITCTNYSVKLEDNDRMGFFFPPPVNGLSITNGAGSNVQFRLSRSFLVSGTVYDKDQGSILSDAEVHATRYPYGGWYQADANRHGIYRMLAPTGLLVVGAGCEGYFNTNYFNSPVTNTSNGVEGADIYLTRSAYWLDTGIKGAGTVNVEGGWQAVGSNVTVTATPGTYWHLDGWSGDTYGSVITNNQITVAIDGYRSLMAVFGADVVTNAVPTWWLVQSGLTNFDDDAMTDADHDGMSTWQEWMAGCDPTNSQSCLGLRNAVLLSSTGFVVRWSSAPGIAYRLDQSVDLSLGFSTLVTNIPATPPENIYTDHVDGVTAKFYRVGVANDALFPPSDMALIPAGSFQLGNCMDPEEGEANELPVHLVNVSAFFMDKYLVTKAKWDEVYSWAVTHGYEFTSSGFGRAPTHPVVWVNWYDCVKWCNARSEKEGRVPVYYTSSDKTTVYRTKWQNVQNDWVKWTAGGYRLPTEAEWEKAARGGSVGQRFPWGNTIDHGNANYVGDPSFFSYDLGSEGWDVRWTGSVKPYTSPVGSFPANGYGLCDMGGNVFQMCWDWYQSGWYATTNAAQSDTRGPASSENVCRVVRGGYWENNAYYVRSAKRYYHGPNISGANHVGFRCVR